MVLFFSSFVYGGRGKWHGQLSMLMLNGVVIFIICLRGEGEGAWAVKHVNVKWCCYFHHLFKGGGVRGHGQLSMLNVVIFLFCFKRTCIDVKYL